MTGVVAATPVHAAAMAAIHAAAFPPVERWDAVTIATQLGLPGVFGALHEGGGMILARAAGGEAEVLTLAVHPGVQRRGIGGALLRDAMAEAWRRGAEAMFLEVAGTNEAARAAYAAAGFRQVGHRRGYYPDGADALVLRADTSAGG